MKKYLWFIVGCLVIIGIVAVFVVQKQSKSPQVTQINNLDLQAQCATQAQKTLGIFAESMTSATPSFTDFSQQNHYNETMNKCFVLISYDGGTIDSASTNNEDLLDAYENSDLADCLYINDKIPPSTECLIGNHSATYQEYSDFINERMELNTPTTTSQ